MDSQIIYELFTAVAEASKYLKLTEVSERKSLKPETDFLHLR